MFLAGVFLGDREPGDPSPERLDFRAAALGQSFAALRPRIGQVFFIGDGRDAGGAIQLFRPPESATRLFLGIADAFGFNGQPGAYGDNSGRYEVTFSAAGAPSPVIGRSVGVRVVRGTVRIKLPAGASQKGGGFEPLTEARTIPVRSILDTTKGTVALRAARNRAGRIQSGQFSAGVFQVLQSRKRRAKGLTTLKLTGSASKFRTCDAGARAAAGLPVARAALSRKAIRRLRARAKGRYRSRGRHSAATVRGTVWTTTDSCAGTLTKVRRGKVAVRDFRRKKTIIVTAGKSYLARAPGS
jgi:hypothetical protein